MHGSKRGKNQKNKSKTMLLSSETLEVTSMILFFANAKNKNKEYED
jgi:hypothetical protein